MAKFIKRRKLGRRKFSFRKRGGGLYKRIKRVERSVKRINRMPETKYLDIYSSPTSATLSAQFQAVNLIAQGTNQSQRVGNQVTATTLDSCFHIMSGTSTVASCIRIMLVYDKNWEYRLATPNAGTYLENTGANAQIVSGYNWENRKRFRILEDFVIPISTQIYPAMTKRFHVKLNKRFTYNGSAATSDYCYNYLFWMWQVDNVGTNAAPVVSVYSRLKFRDE